MLTRLIVRNFKLFEEIDIALDSSVAFVGPNNSGKSSALQALSLWNLGVRRWHERRASGDSNATKRTGVTINRIDLFSVALPSTNLLWRGRHMRDVVRENGKPMSSNVRIDIVVEGISQGAPWKCGLEFDYSNEESIYCRPMRLEEGKKPERMPFPDEALGVQVAYLPPMSGLAATEYHKHSGEIDFLIGQGQTAEVLRNLCFKIFKDEEDSTKWSRLQADMKRFFGVTLQAPSLFGNSEIGLKYKEADGTELDITSSGRGFQQTLLLLAHVYANPETVLLLDEPDAHLEILRQREMYDHLSAVVKKRQSQLICASHSEVVLRQAAEKDSVVAFVGKPHVIGNTSQVLKALKDISFEHFCLAEQQGWILYLEGSTDLEILRRFAATLNHPAASCLERPFVHYVGNQPKKAEEHFYGLREACAGLRGVAILDRLERPMEHSGPLQLLTWEQREIENYLCSESVLMAYAHGQEYDDLLAHAESENRMQTMQACIQEVSGALATLNDPSPWSKDIKASDKFLTPLFKKYFESLSLPILLSKGKYHELAELVEREAIVPEISQKLDAILNVAQEAAPKRP